MSCRWRSSYQEERGLYVLPLEIQLSKGEGFIYIPLDNWISNGKTYINPSPLDSWISTGKTYINPSPLDN
jgi:hypothetical protein